jgi:hypothetical protein
MASPIEGIVDESSPTEALLINHQLSKYRPVFLEHTKDDDMIAISHRLEQAEAKIVTLYLDRYAKLMSIKSEVDAAVSKSKTSRNYKYSRHLGGHIYVNVCSKFPCVDIRQFYMYNKELKATKQGVALHFAEWYFFKQAHTMVCEVLPQVMDMKHCSDTHDVENFESALACKECFPY